VNLVVVEEKGVIPVEQEELEEVKLADSTAGTKVVEVVQTEDALEEAVKEVELEVVAREGEEMEAEGMEEAD
jgi:hypothetical protein